MKKAYLNRVKGLSDENPVVVDTDKEMGITLIHVKGLKIYTRYSTLATMYDRSVNDIKSLVGKLQQSHNVEVRQWVDGSQAVNLHHFKQALIETATSVEL